MSKQIYLFSTSSHPDTINVNSLHVTLLRPDIDFYKYDYLIITSKQVSNALKCYNNDYIAKKALCISKHTATSYESIGGTVLDIADGYGDDISKLVMNYPKKSKWLYLRAKEIASDFVSTCRNGGFNIDEKIIYETSCSKDIETLQLKPDSVFIFTSPSSIKCFLNSHQLSSDSKVVVIGETTAKSVPKGVIYKLSDETSIESCIKLAKTF
ncbi:uroporphyrinogen-III synthase [Sulfurimonas sp.]|nr:uroporphyrinogen-III synthase [Sulfurimonas sp.]